MVLCYPMVPFSAKEAPVLEICSDIIDFSDYWGAARNRGLLSFS
jgi:hypothetical protein